MDPIHELGRPIGAPALTHGAEVEEASAVRRPALMGPRDKHPRALGATAVAHRGSMEEASAFPRLVLEQTNLTLQTTPDGSRWLPVAPDGCC